jgi:hypothetical protein
MESARCENRKGLWTKSFRGEGEESEERVSKEIHDSRIVMVKVDADLGIAHMVAELNTISGVRTTSSCQGTIGEGLPHPYRAYVLCEWTPEALEILKTLYIVRPQGNGKWGYVHPLRTQGQPDGVQEDSAR